MNGDRIARALARIEAAAGRIDAAGRNRASNDPTLETKPDLDLKYAALRDETAGALAEIDRLIAGLET